ncbi:DUF3817 domain-containing protein [Corynebacterium appendicis]|uniref:DUF3817 domain-containing protein n=1 Tax=Corynebacterium appendicis TaxID=163202 RepID=UPI00223AB8A1|nr:DUF3817 domain-containing protein [Corynebacterium appendicis]MCT1683240.1 DUF3817 domain-containing protein [Corynebacterium appendicis]MDK8626615.1 DUF3817 domain-containing protein [Corynebacterium appendicis]
MTDNPADTSAPTSAPGASSTPRVHPERQRRVRTALRLFSVAAWITGVMLLLLCARMIMEYGFDMDVSLLSWVAILHGWMYALFLLATLNLGMKARWSTSQWIVTAIAGVVPFLSFFVEAWRRKEVTEEFDL